MKNKKAKFSLLSIVQFIIMSIVGLSCVTISKKKQEPSQFYKNTYVRRCLQYDKENIPTQSQACWADLLHRIRHTPNFVQKNQYTDSDLDKIEQLAADSRQYLARLEQEKDACLNIPAGKRAERIGCLETFLKKYTTFLSQTQKYEIKMTINELQEVKQLADGQLEATIEHAGKLLGAELLMEVEGVRIVKITSAPLSQTKVAEESIIISIDDILTEELSFEERIARLESCEDKPVTLLIRHGGINNITFYQVQVDCRNEKKAVTKNTATIPQITCSQVSSPEISWGLSWCYSAKGGILRVDQVCANSAAHNAGVLPGHNYSHINGVSLLGKTIDQINQIVQASSETGLVFSETGGSLQSPNQLTGPPLPKESQAKCWQAIESNRNLERYQD
jgi:hypothetical protein